MKHLLLSLLLFPLIFSAQAQQKEKKTYRVHITRTDSAVVLDGVLSESVWQRAEVAKDFFMNFPSDSTLASSKSEIRLTYNDQYLYIAALCYDDTEKTFISTSLKRDYDPGNSDNIMIFMDPFNDGINGFMFYVSPLGVEGEGLMSQGGNISLSWDNKWYSKTKIHKGYWIVEMAIPFTTLRFKPESNMWKMNFGRADLKRNEFSSWIPVPTNYDISSLAFSGEIIFDQPLKKPGPNISLIPYIGSTYFKRYSNFSGLGAGSLRTRIVEDKPEDHESDYEMREYKLNTGFDAKVAVTPSLNLDLTVNPDFSQVEVDVQVTNLSRFELFFPERRQFFMENSDLFSEFGFSKIRPFFSRRIGIGRDATTGQIVQNPIYYGARLSGKINKDWRIGVMNMQTAQDKKAGIKTQNYTVAAIQRQVFSRSNISAIFVNRQRFGDEYIGQFDKLGDDSLSTYTRLFGLDYNLQSKDNKWSGKIFYHKALKPEKLSGTSAHAAYLGYRGRNVAVFWNHEYVGKNYNINDIGYVARTGLYRVEPFIEFTFYTKDNKKLNRHGLSIYNNIYTDLNYKLTDFNTSVFYRFIFTDTRYIEAGINRDYTLLFSSFDPTNTGGKKLAEGTKYDVIGGYVFYASDRRKLFSYNGSISYGGYFNGTMFGANTEVRYRYQPYGSVGVVANYNSIHLPEGYNSTNLVLVGTRIDLSFSRKTFLTTFVQYNDQADNVNLNARFQWRFKPVSDLFIVYSDNYLPGNLKVKNRSLVLKLSYWLNV